MRKLASLLLACSLLIGLTACSTGSEGSALPKVSESVEPSSTLESTDVDYPDGDLYIQVPFKTGGALDVQARTTAKYLADELGVNVVVQNKIGAGGVLGTTNYLQEKANTSTILLTDAWLLTVNPLLNPVEYTIDDYMPIIDHNVTKFCLFASPGKSGISSYEDLLDYGKSNRVLFGSGGPGTSLYIIQKTLLDQLGMKSDTITQNGASEGIVNLMAGTVDIAMSTFSDEADNVKSGKLVPILWFGDKAYSDDDAYASGVPTASEKGIDINYQGFYFYSIRKGTDQAIIDKLYNAFSAVYANPDYIAKREQVGFEPTGMNGAEISDYVKTFADQAKNTFSLK